MKKETICIQSGWKPGNGEPRVLPIYQSTTFKYESSEQMGRLFDLEESGTGRRCGGYAHIFRTGGKLLCGI